MKIKPYINELATTSPFTSPFSTRRTRFKHQTWHFGYLHSSFRDCSPMGRKCHVTGSCTNSEENPTGKRANSPNSSVSSIQPQLSCSVIHPHSWAELSWAVRSPQSSLGCSFLWLDRMRQLEAVQTSPKMALVWGPKVPYHCSLPLF